MNARHLGRGDRLVEHRAKFSDIARIGRVYTDYRNAKVLRKMI